ncbi:MAG TPA: hypothetical protein VI942_01720 [Thermoanaerobaculia bacterium]|nr:hypothetical protein [Thermoanaerobaculia bacterium]
MKVVQEGGRKWTTAFENMLNPTLKLEKQLATLEAQGKSAGDIVKVLGDKIKGATDVAARNGQEIGTLSAKYRDLAKSSEAASKEGVERLGASLQDFARNPLQAAQAGMGSLLEKLGPTATGFAGVAAVVVAAGAGIFKLASDAGSAAEQLVNLAASTGLSLKELQVFNRISEEMGLGTEGVTRAIERLQAQLGTAGGGDFTNALASFNIALVDVKGNMRPIADLLDDFRAKLLAIEDPQRRAQVLMAALGGRGRELARLLLEGGQSLRAWGVELEKAGVIKTDEAIKRAAEFDTKLDKLGQRWKALARIFQEGAVDIATAILDAFKTGPTFPATGLLGSAVPLGGGPSGGGGGGGFGPAVIGNEITSRATMIARLKAMQTGASPRIANLQVEIGEARQKFAAMEKTANSDELLAQTKIIAQLERRLKVEQDLEASSKRLAEQSVKTIKKIDEELAAKFGAKSSGFSDITAPPGPSPELLKLLESRQEGTKYLSGLAEYAPGRGQADLNKGTIGGLVKYADQRMDAAASAARKFTEEQHRGYLKMIDDVRDGAGHVFDDMFQRGKSVFESLANLVEGLFNTVARRIFQNFAQLIFAPGSMQGGWSGIFSNVLGVGVKGLGGLGGAGGVAGAATGGGVPLFSGPYSSGMETLGGGLGALPKAASAGGGTLSLLASAAPTLGITAGLALLAAGAKKGNVPLGAAGGFFTGGFTGMAIGGSGALAGTALGAWAGPIGAGIGAAVGALLAKFGPGAGERRRAKERARRAGIQEGYLFDPVGAESRSTGFGGESDVAAGLTGRLSGFRGTINLTVHNSFVDAAGAERVAPAIARSISRDLLSGGGPLGDTVAWVAG